MSISEINFRNHRVKMPAYMCTISMLSRIQFMSQTYNAARAFLTSLFLFKKLGVNDIVLEKNEITACLSQAGGQFAVYNRRQ